jgi:hypothetical protein
MGKDELIDAIEILIVKEITADPTNYVVIGRSGAVKIEGIISPSELAKSIVSLIEDAQKERLTPS